MRIKPHTAALLSVIIILSGVFVSHLLGLWTTVSTKAPQKYEQSSFENQNNPADIRGSYTLSEVSQLFQIPLNDLASAFQVESNAAQSFKCKDIESRFTNASNKIGTDSIRLFTAIYLGLPFDLNEDIYLPSQAAEIIKEKGKATSDQLEYLKNHTAVIDINLE